MSNIKSEFEKLFISQRSYRSSDKEAFIRGCEAAFKHQQSKVDELTKQRDSFIKAYEIEIDKSIELQKRVDAALKITSDNLQYVSQNHRDIFKPLLMTMIRSFKELEQALNDGENE